MSRLQYLVRQRLRYLGCAPRFGFSDDESAGFYIYMGT